MLKFYNTLTKTTEEFSPINKKEVQMYTCGPTVYNYPHIGNYRAYVFADILKRTLIYNEFKVKHIMNLTDVDDKTIRDSQKENKSLNDFTKFYAKAFFEDIKSLNILEPTKWTYATEYIPQMISIIEKLLEKDFAYKSADGSIYFNIRKFKNYGKLSGIKLEGQLENAGGRINTDEYDKDNVQDFALWKAWTPEDGDVYWDVSFSKGLPRTELALVRGRPGWHIECSAMSMENLGDQIDIHTGGVDNIFPHHENEIAQSECATGVQFVKYWMHNEWVLVDNKKMAKSFNNFFTLKDLIRKNINPLSYRLWLLTANYRTRVNFTWETLEGSETAFKKLNNSFVELGEKIGQINQGYKEKFQNFINDDLDTPKALALLWDLVKDEKVSDPDKKATILDFDKVFGLGFEDIKEEIIPAEITKIAEEREFARKNKDFAKSDELRDKIKSLGYEIEDKGENYKIKKI